MKFTYLTDESEKTLAPFFSPPIISATALSLGLMGALIVLFWPRVSLFTFISQNAIPRFAFLFFSAALIIHSYINLCCGRGEMFKKIFDPGLRQEQFTHEKEHDFFQYALIALSLHALFWTLPVLPLLILAGSVSAISFRLLVEGIGLIFMTSFVCRLFGFLMYLWRGRSSTLGYYLGRAFWAFLVFGTLGFGRRVNPLYVLYTLNLKADSIAADSISPFSLTMGTIIGATVILALVNQAIVKRGLNRKTTH